MRDQVGWWVVEENTERDDQQRWTSQGLVETLCKENIHGSIVEYVACDQIGDYPKCHQRAFIWKQIETHSQALGPV